MPTSKGKKAVERTTNIRVDKEVQAKLVFLTQLRDKNMSEIIEAMINELYPTIKEDMEQWEKNKRNMSKKYEEGGGK